ncbi:DUF6455 family protein [Celeribacter marinus]|uniref:Uncharacterized protein n=1 Tax=Celeribacter marinus TaxID=1397108 RepID=A0A0P0AAT0_9RHOB|nr:DUF6455 family protein [Celeribacter marinus]ALI55031.1 hypothetical protein IMCC12053_1083 [Celeribacter marinus]SFK05259.1 hypothetical protein SAMN05444421_101238 [Celeribacter marinus]
MMMNDTLKPGQATLMHGMAERLGADIAAAVNSGDLSGSEVSQMVTQCGQCTQHDACILWMLEHQGPQNAAPDYCLNTQELSYVRATQSRVTSD